MGQNVGFADICKLVWPAGRHWFRLTWMRPLSWACVEWLRIQTLQPQTLSNCETIILFFKLLHQVQEQKSVSIDFGVICVNGSWQ